jgi:uncharacterized Zn finger protein
MALADASGDPEVMPRHAANLGVALRRILGPMRSLHEALVVCRSCGSDFVNPVSWHEQGEAHWWIRLRCGECGLVREVEVSNDEANRYDAELDRGVTKIASTLTSLDRARMVAEADVFKMALERDLIGPGDFRT